MGSKLGIYYEIWNLRQETVGGIIDDACILFGNRVRDVYFDILMDYQDGFLKYSPRDVFHRFSRYLNDLFRDYHINIRVSI